MNLYILLNNPSLFKGSEQDFILIYESGWEWSCCLYCPRTTPLPHPSPLATNNRGLDSRYGDVIAYTDYQHAVNSPLSVEFGDPQMINST